jgi:biopolymer transport protein ExbB
MDDFAQFYQEGGFFMHPIALSAVLGAGVMVERFIFLFFRFNINGGQFFNQVQKLVMANNIDRAIKLCNAADKAALARVMKAGLTRANKSEADIASAIEESLLEVTPAISKRISMIAAIANIATLLGLLGTIFGMIEAFNAVATVAADQRSQALAKGISHRHQHDRHGSRWSRSRCSPRRCSSRTWPRRSPTRSIFTRSSSRTSSPLGCVRAETRACPGPGLRASLASERSTLDPNERKEVKRWPARNVKRTRSR